MNLQKLDFAKYILFLIVLAMPDVMASEIFFVEDCDFSLPSSRDGSFSPDGKRIVFTSARNGNSDIFMMNADGSDAMPLVKLPAGEYYPSFSPDGKKITFMSLSSDSKFLVIYVVDADGKNLKEITENDGYNGDPNWSPDGKKIVFFSERDGHEQIYLMDADGSNQKRLTNNDAKDYTPVFSPDGKKILFISERDGNAEIYVMNPDGSDQTRVTKSELANRVAKWSPDGKKIIYYSRDSKVPSKESWEGAEIEIINADGTGRKKLTDNKYPDQGPVFSPDGKKILFTSCRTGNREIFLMNSKGSKTKRLTFSNSQN